MVDNLHVGTTLAGSPQEDGCTFIQRHIYTSVFMTTTHRYMKDKTFKVLQIVYLVLSICKISRKSVLTFKMR